MPLQEYQNILMRYLKPQWPRVVFLGLLLFGNIGLQLINPQILRRFIDTAQTGGPVQILLQAAFLFSGIALLQQMISVSATYLSEMVGWRATNSLRIDLVDHCLRLDMSFHNAHAPGEMIERIDGDVMTLSNFFSRFIIEVLGNFFLLAGILVFLFLEDWRVGAALTGFSLVALFTLNFFHKYSVLRWKGERQATADLFGFLEERLLGIEDLRANGAEEYTMQQFHLRSRSQVKNSVRAAVMGYSVFTTMVTLFGLGVALSFLVGGRLFLGGGITIGTVYVIFFYMTMMEAPINQITRQIQDLQRAGAGVARIKDLLNLQGNIREPVPVPGRMEGAVSARLSKGPLAVEFRDISFAYKNSSPAGPAEVGTPIPEELDERILHHISFCLQPGTVLGLLGRTGSGKTTLTRLLFRLYDPDQGEIRIGTPGSMVCVQQIPTVELRDRIGLITQNVQLFHASVRNNITFFDRSIPDERILQIIQELGLGKWFNSLPQGLDTVLEPGNRGLSAGEAQLLAFTRIFLKDLGVVILDEASSRLDPVTERLVNRAIETLIRDHTVIIIAHRLETLLKTDEIMILEEGQIREYGPQLALKNNPASRFSELLEVGLEDILE